MPTLTYSEHFRKMRNSKRILLTEEDELFLNWIDKVEEGVLRYTGFKLLDLPDENYYVEFQGGCRVEDMVSVVRENFSKVIVDWTIAAC